MVKVSTHKSFSLASKKAKSLALKNCKCITIKRNGAKFEVHGGAK